MRRKEKNDGVMTFQKPSYLSTHIRFNAAPRLKAR
jgi:hypothetical protein